jgi:DNA-binding beta-propeller fold protein YncE
MAGVTLASTSIAAVAAGAPPAAAVTATTNISIPGLINGITQPLANGSMWALTILGNQEVMYQVSIRTHRLLGAEQVSNKADSISISANGGTLAVGTTGGAYPAEVWYNGKTGRYTSSARSSGPVYQVAVNAAGDSIIALRGTSTGASTARQVFGVGTSNGLGLPYSLPVSAVALALQPSTKGALILQANGTVGHLAFFGGLYINQFSTGGPANSMVLSPDGSTLYVLRAEADISTSDTIAEVNVAHGTVSKVLQIGQYCAGISLSPDGSTLYEALRGAKSTIKAVPVP